MRFTSKATPIGYIDSKCHNKVVRLFDWLFRLHITPQITPLVIHNLGRGHTHTYQRPHQSDFKKPFAAGQRAYGLKKAPLTKCGYYALCMDNKKLKFKR